MKNCRLLAYCGWNASPSSPRSPCPVDDAITVLTSRNGAGRIAFHAYLQSGGAVNSTNNEGIWSSAIGGLTLVARKGDQAPGAPSGAVFSYLPDPGITESGHVAFSAALAGNVTPGVNDSGIWEQDANGNLFNVALTGDVIQVAPGDFRTIGSLIAYPGSNDGHLRDLNNIDQIAFWARFTDNSEGIFVTVGPDGDGDGVNNAFDSCQNDPGKSSPGLCGCGVPDTDSDKDGSVGGHDDDRHNRNL